jgi:hypothetical protein
MIMLGIFIGYMASWIKGGGVESTHTYFLILGLLLIPSRLQASRLTDGGMRQTPAEAP